MNLKKSLKSPIYKVILRFFRDNPSAVDTARGIATWTDLELSEVRGSLKKLASLNILSEHKVTSTLGYSLARSKKNLSKIREFLQK